MLRKQEMFAVIKLKNDNSTEEDGVLHYSGNDSNEHMTWDNGSYYSEIFRDTRHQISGFGYISELIITDSILSSNLRDSIHSHLNNKWGDFDKIY